ncbi:MAG TPA: DUF503 domain-containing protein [Thermodesulfobacteriota bacterium]
MVVGVCQLDVMVHDSDSLKAKRSVLRRVIARVHQTFPVAIAEVGNHDIWQRATLGVSVVGNEEAHVNAVLDKVVNFVDGLHLVEILDHQIELLHY